MSFDIGKNDYIQIKKTFNATLNIHIAIAILVLILAETIGLWFVNYKLNIASERVEAANWVYQFSILTFLIGVIQVPYDALIIARERMNVYAYMSIIEAVLKLLIVYLLLVVDFDHLILYSFLYFLVTFIVRLAHKIYCKTYFKESKYLFYYDKKLYIELLNYSGWNLFGNIASIAKGQGINVLLNMFFGTVLNATYGIALQVQAAVSLFVTNFQMAVNPQIIKKYAVGDVQQCKNLIYQSSKFSYLLMFIIIMPILFNIDFILNFWLKIPPNYTSLFVNLCLVNLLIDCLSGPIMTGIQATGNIKWYQIVVGSLLFLNLPVSYLILKYHEEPVVVYYVSISISIISLFFRIYFISKSLSLSIRDFFLKVIVKIVLVTIITILLFLIIEPYFTFFNQWVLFLSKSFVLLVITIVSTFLLGIDGKERNYLKEIILKKIKK
ncbi:lipopolysaccharide biosynthesis protein [Flavobacterium gelidilacus]|uniref:lipopolysaccharide biosynthesis protein n=1 Tax=Flavobacterium gelidilacus TaxID=206041 RepID=UPI001FE1BA7A|nr:lipopolysaccharide biosynthesis protein [Flavobacterium gelidilacus]